MYSFIYDEYKVRDFFLSVVPPLGNSEVYFLSLSARNKYLSEPEREYYGLGRTEMFARSIVRHYDVEKFIKALRRYECSYGSYLTKKGLDIPEKCIIVYMNINPSNAILAYKEFSHRMGDILIESAYNSDRGKNLPKDDLSKFTKLDVELMDSFQRSTGIKHYIDIDFDIEERGFYLVEEFLSVIDHYSGGVAQYAVVDTKGGYHVLLKRDTIKFNYLEVVNHFNNKLSSTDVKHPMGRTTEIVVNKNLMIPIPGTYQGGYPVRLMFHKLNHMASVRT